VNADTPEYYGWMDNEHIYYTLVEGPKVIKKKVYSISIPDGKITSIAEVAREAPPFDGPSFYWNRARECARVFESLHIPTHAGREFYWPSVEEELVRPHPSPNACVSDDGRSAVMLSFRDLNAKEESRFQVVSDGSLIGGIDTALIGLKHVHNLQLLPNLLFLAAESNQGTCILVYSTQQQAPRQVKSRDEDLKQILTLPGWFIVRTASYSKPL
jgi:hypothetical protein